MWIARGDDDFLAVYDGKPDEVWYDGRNWCLSDDNGYIELDPKLFENVTVENSPIEIEFTTDTDKPLLWVARNITDYSLSVTRNRPILLHTSSVWVNDNQNDEMMLLPADHVYGELKNDKGGLTPTNPIKVGIKMTGTIGFFLRCGDLPKDGKSSIYEGNGDAQKCVGYEEGISCYRCYLDFDDVPHLILPNPITQTTINTLYSLLNSDRPWYLISAIDLHKVGRDGEPLVKNAMVRRKVEIKRRKE